MKRLIYKYLKLIFVILCFVSIITSTIISTSAYDIVIPDNYSPDTMIPQGPYITDYRTYTYNYGQDHYQYFPLVNPYISIINNSNKATQMVSLANFSPYYYVDPVDGYYTNTSNYLSSTQMQVTQYHRQGDRYMFRYNGIITTSAETNFDLIFTFDEFCYVPYFNQFDEHSPIFELFLDQDFDTDSPYFDYDVHIDYHFLSNIRHHQSIYSGYDQFLSVDYESIIYNTDEFFVPAYEDQIDTINTPIVIERMTIKIHNVQFVNRRQAFDIYIPIQSDYEHNYSMDDLSYVYYGYPVLNNFDLNWLTDGVFAFFSTNILPGISLGSIGVMICTVSIGTALLVIIKHMR